MKKRIVLAWIWALVVGLLLAHNAYLWLGKRVAPDTDILALLPVQERDPVLQKAFKQMVDAAQQRVIVLVGASDWPQAMRAADVYRSALASHADLFEFSDGASERTQQDWLASFERHRLVLLTPQDEAALRTRPQQYWVDNALAKLYSPFSGPRLGAWQDDPFGLFGSWLQARAQETPVRPRDGHLFVADAQKQYVVLPITLRKPAFSIGAQQAVMPLLADARRAAQQAVAQSDVIAAGVVLHAAAAGEQAARETSTIGIGSLAGIVLLMWLTFRSFKPVALILLSIGIGCIGALSVCLLLLERIHLLTLVFGASLIGVAQDYGIYFLCNRLGADKTLDSSQLLRQLAPGLVLTLVTTVIGYLGLALTPFPGLQQMALFSILGLLFAWLTVVLWFPALVSATTLKDVGGARRYGTSLSRWPLLGSNRKTLVAGALLAAFTVFGLAKLGFNDDIRLLQNPPKSLVDDQIRLSKLLDAPTPVQFYLVRGATSEIVLQREEMLTQRLELLVADHAISGYQAMSNWAPSLQLQVARQQLIDKRLLTQDGPLAALAKTMGEDEQWIMATRDRLRNAAAPLTPEAFLKTPASEPWRHLWLGNVEGGYAGIVAFRGMKSGALPQLQNAAAGLEGVQWVDKVGEISAVLGRYRRYMGWVVLASYLAVYCLLLPRYRGAAWRVLLPTALGSVATLAVLGAAGQHLQLFHVLALMLLLGIGVDYGIFLHEHPGQQNTSAWLAIGLSALSTLLSFGLLGLSKTPALQAFGLTMSLGVIAVWLVAPCFGSNRLSKD